MSRRLLLCIFGLLIPALTATAQSSADGDSKLLSDQEYLTAVQQVESKAHELERSFLAIAPHVKSTPAEELTQDAISDIRYYYNVFPLIRLKEKTKHSLKFELLLITIMDAMSFEQTGMSAMQPYIPNATLNRVDFRELRNKIYDDLLERLKIIDGK